MTTLPVELTSRPNWVFWKLETRKGKPTKVPYAVTGGMASSTDPTTWAQFDAAIEAMKNGHGYNGVGFVFDGAGITGIDLDHCIDNDGVVEPWAQEIVNRLDSYTELSPSGKGLHVFIRGTLAEGLRNRKGQIEIYSRGRYFTITGKHFEGTPTDIHDRQVVLMEVHRDIFGQENRPTSATEPGPRVSIEDDVVLSQLRNNPKFVDLFDRGNTDPYNGDDSAADLALCCLLVRVVGNDQDQVDRLFRQSALMREKWDRKDYRDRTITKAVETVENPPLRYYHRTDSGMGMAFAKTFGNRFRYNHDRGKWGLFDRTKWDFDRGDAAVRRAVVELARILRQDALNDPDHREAIEDFARSMENHNKISNILAEARNYPPLASYSSDFDLDDWLFNAANGTIDLRTGTLRPHNPADMLTRKAPVVFDPSSTCERFEKFLMEIMEDNAAMVAFLRRLLGMCLSGDISEQILPIFYGSGSNGKSVLIDIIKLVMGPYAADAAPELLIQKFNQEHPTEIADLQGRRLVVCSESEKRAKLKEQFMKRLTGDSTLKGRFMRQDYFEFRRSHKLILITNNVPVVTEDSEAVWRRIRLVPFNRIFTAQERDTRLIDKLKAEQSGILNRLIKGCLEWQRNGLGYPDEVSKATSDYRKSQNPLDDFLSQRTELDPSGVVSVAAMSECYKSWCAACGVDPIMPKDFNQAMLARGFSKGTVREEDRVFKAWEGLVIC